MRPYLAIVKDSFREALRSWSLWVVLILITLFLVLLAPLSVTTRAITGLSGIDLAPIDARQLVLQLQRAHMLEETSPARTIYDRLDPKTQERVSEEARKIVETLTGGDDNADEEERDGPPPAIRQLVGDLRDELDAQLEMRDFYDPEAWRRVALRPEAVEPRERGLDTLSQEELARFNRVALESAFPTLIRITPSRGYAFTYLGWDLHGDTIPVFTLEEPEFKELLTYALQTGMTWVFGIIGVLIALIATAPIMPQTFETGALSLLLSKPVSRWATLVAKYLGGCAFVTVCVAYLTVGLTLLFGVRLGIWEWRFLYFIPMFVFVFAIYYSVSAVAGVIFRSTIVSLALVFVFWLSCFGLWAAKVSMETLLVQTQANRTLVVHGDEKFAVTLTGAVLHWNDDEQAWRQVFLSNDDPADRGVQFRLGPAYDPSRDALFAQREFRVFGMPTPMPETYLSFATVDGNWQRRRGMTIGAGAEALFIRPPLEFGEGDDAEALDTTLILAGPAGIREIAADPLKEPNAAERFNPMSFIPGFGPFEILTQETLDLPRPTAYAMHAASGDILVYARGELLWFETQVDGSYELVLRERLEGEEGAQVSLDVGGPRGAPLAGLARADGTLAPIRLVRGESPTFEMLPVISPEGENVPRRVMVRPDGSEIAVLYHVGTLWTWDAETGETRKPSIRGQGGLTAAAWVGNDAIAVSDKYLRTTIAGAEDYAVTERLDAETDIWFETYRWLVLPAYTVFPKPGELDRTMTYLLTGRQSDSELFAQFISAGLDLPRATFDPYTPVWSGLLFIVVLLAFGGWWFSRQEF